MGFGNWRGTKAAIAVAIAAVAVVVTSTPGSARQALPPEAIAAAHIGSLLRRPVKLDPRAWLVTARRDGEFESFRSEATTAQIAGRLPAKVATPEAVRLCGPGDPDCGIQP